MKLRKTTKRWISMALTLLMMITSVFTGDYAIFAADSEEYTYADGYLVTEPVKGTAYAFNFQNKDSEIYDTSKESANPEMKCGTFGLMTVEKAGKFHSTDHGMNGQAQMTFKVAGNCMITIGGCQFTGQNDQFVLKTTTGALDAVSKAAKTAKCYNRADTSGQDRVSFCYVGDAGTVTVSSPGSYIPEILITPLADDYIPQSIMVADGMTAAQMAVNTSYYYDFRIKDSVLYNLDSSASEPTLNTGVIGLMEVRTPGRYKDSTHGMQGKTEFTIQVPGDCSIMIGGCRWGGDIKLNTESGTLDQTVQSSKTQNCYSESQTDGSDRIVFEYTGNAGTVTLTANTYIPYILVTPSELQRPEVTRQIEVWDFGAKQEEDTQIYHNNITQAAWDANGLIGENGTLDGTVNTDKIVNFGTLAVKYENGDSIQGGVNALKFVTGGVNYTTFSYEDGYCSDGVWKCNGKGGNTRRCVTLNDVSAGDKIVAYMGSYTKETDKVHFLYKGTQGTQDDTADIGNAACKRYEFIAQYSGQYQIYVGSTTNVKPVYHRILQIPPVEVTGTVDIAGTDIAEYGVKFINTETLEEVQAKVRNGMYKVSLTPGYTYTAVLTENVGFGFTDACKNITVQDTDVINGKQQNLFVESKNVCELKGNISGFDTDYDTSALRVILKAPQNSEKEDVVFIPDEQGTYSVSIEPDVTYTITLNGVNDYEPDGTAQIRLTQSAQENIHVVKKETYTVSGAFTGLDVPDTVTALQFVNMEDRYIYDAAISANSYQLKLRNGTYEVKAEAGDYQTVSHIVVENQAVARDLLFLTTKKEKLEWVPDIYVGYDQKEHNYQTVREAVKACKAMNPSDESKRITVHIAPGVYREQVLVDTPYVTFINDEPEKEVLLTWYYGIGYEYYSIGADGYYSEAAAYDKFEKNTAQKWGAAVYIKNTATAFRAQNITFESSFNKYITDEELADGVTPGGPDIKNFERTKDSDVASGEATERASALAVEGSQSEFYECRIVSSQDTLYTGNNIQAYFKNCFIDGNTDYIFGGGDVLFDACELSYYGYSNTQKGAYITAAADGSTTGYIFRNCYVSANDAWDVAAGYFGRPWRSSATVAFLNTKLQTKDTVTAVGWNSMSGARPEDANYQEYNTTVLGSGAADVSARTAGTVKNENPYADIVQTFKGWQPFYFVQETDTAVTVKDIAIEGELKTGSVLKALYTLSGNEKADASVLEWYRITPSGEETLVKAVPSYADKSYTITQEDAGCSIKLVIKPETISGTTGDSKSFVSAQVPKQPTKPEQPSKPEQPDVPSFNAATVWTVGDSTVCSFNDTYYYPRYGWGTQLEHYFDSSLTVKNLALSGRSSKSYVQEEQYQTLMQGMKAGDYLFVGFGHNDEKADEGRYTNPNGNYLTEGSFANSLYVNYVKPAQEKGVTVVLCTPIVRRTATGIWEDSNLHITSDSGKFEGGNYAEAIRKMGEDLDITVVDMTTLTKNLYDELGADETLNLHAWTSSSGTSVDNTHTNIYGARYNAYMMTRILKEQNIPGLSEHIKEAQKPLKSEVLQPNPDYKEAEYTPVTDVSQLWKQIGIWSGSVFGDLGGKPSKATHVLEGLDNNTVHIKSTKGKITDTSDGIAMYYYKVPAKSVFTLSAKMRVLSYDVHDQASFGLMVRDAVWLDMNTKDMMGDYVAAGPLKLSKQGNVWNCFARKSGALTRGGICVNEIAAGDVIDVKIESSTDGYACTFGKEETITGGFDFKLTSIDSDYVYVGMYVARNADVTFSDVKLIVDGKEVTAEPEQPSEPEQPTTPERPTTPEQPTTPSEPTKPEQPTTPSEPTTPEQPTTPSEPTTPEQPTTPSEPTTPEQPTTPSEPTTPEQPTVPAEPTAPSEPAIPTETKTTVTVNGSGTVTVPETVEFVGADGSVLKNTKLSLNIVKEGQAYDTAAQQMKAAIENEMPEILKNSSISYLEMNLTDEAGQTVTFKNGKMGVTLEYPAGTGKSGYSFAVLHLTENGLETLMPQLTDTGLYVEVSSFSPFAVVYQTVNEQPTTPSEPEQPTVSEPTTVQPTTEVLPTQTVHPSTEGSAATTSDAQTEDTGVVTADTMRAVPFVLMMFAAMTAFVVLAGRKKKEVK